MLKNILSLSLSNGGSYNSDHANHGTSMKFRTPTQFDALKNIGVGCQLKFAPECFFRQG